MAQECSRELLIDMGVRIEISGRYWVQKKHRMISVIVHISSSSSSIVVVVVVAIVAVIQ